MSEYIRRLLSKVKVDGVKGMKNIKIREREKKKIREERDRY